MINNKKLDNLKTASILNKTYNLENPSNIYQKNHKSKTNHLNNTF